MSAKQTWCLVADGGRATFYMLEGQGRLLRVSEAMTIVSDHSPSRELSRDKPGRVHESVGTLRHAIEPSNDPHRALKAKFALKIAGVLDEKWAHGELDQLFIIAPPVLLGDLRKSISRAVKSKVVGEAALDLTKSSEADIVETLRGLMQEQLPN